jgi:signal transduction histidine kinase
MTSGLWIDGLTAVAQLAIGLACIARARHAAVAIPLAAFAFCVAAWSAAEVGFGLTDRLEWTLIDHAASPQMAPLALDIAFTLDDRRRALRAPLLTAYVLCGAVAAASALSLFVPALRSVFDTRTWTIWVLCAGIPTLAVAVFSLFAHLQRATDRAEEERTRLVIAAFAIATLLGSTEVLTPLAPLVPRVPSAGKLGLLVGTATVALASLRLPWLDSPQRLRRTTYGLAAAGIALLVAIAMFGLGGTGSQLLLGTLAGTVALIAASRRWAVDAAVRKEKVSQLATLGRFSAQMAHDLKNPLAALKGAAQLLKDDVAALPAPAGSEEQSASSLVELMLEEIDRLARVVDTYRRLANIDVARTRVDVNGVVRDVVRLQALVPASGVSLRTALDDALPACAADRDMIAAVVENLVRNAVEALPSGGEVTVRTRRAEGEEGAGVVVAVEDTGVGMDASTRERAFDDFFTTKATGSGLGLAFTKRVVEAHGGVVSITSTEGHGTVVRFRLPAA